MPVTDKIKRYGIGGIGYPVGPVNLRKPLSGSIPAELSRLSGGYALVDRWEVTTGSGLSAGDYTFRVGPYSERGFKASHRALGDISVFLQVGGGANPLATVSCLGRKRPADSSKITSLGPFTAAEGDRMWLVVERKDFSTLKYQVEVEFVEAETGGSYWVATLSSGGGYEVAYGVAPGPSESMYVTGQVQQGSTSLPDLVLVKLMADGLIEWQRGLASDNIDRGTSVAVDGDGNAIVVGRTQLSTSPFTVYILIAKYSPTGVLQWQRRLSNSEADPYGYDIAVDSGDNILISGVGDGALVIKLASDGSLTWQRQLGEFGLVAAYAIATDSANNVIIAAEALPDGPGKSQCVIAKYNSSGALQWQRALGATSSDDAGFAIAVDSADNIYVAANIDPGDFFFFSIVLAKYSSGGVIQWQRQLDGTGNQKAFSLAASSDDQVIVAGVDERGSSDDVILMARYNSSGTLLWTRYLAGPRNSTGYGLALSASGGILVAGGTDYNFAGSGKIVVASLPADGTLIGVHGAFTYTEPSGLVSISIALAEAESTLVDSAAALTDSASTLSTAIKTVTAAVTPVD